MHRIRAAVEPQHLLRTSRMQALLRGRPERRIRWNTGLPGHATHESGALEDFGRGH